MQVFLPRIMVHRFGGAEEDGQLYSPALIGQFFGTHSYVMKGTNGQLALAAGDRFEKGNGPFARVKVLSIDEANQVATVQLCYSAVPQGALTVKIGSIDSDNCRSILAEGSEAKFGFTLTHGKCTPMYTVLWSVSGAKPVAGQANDASQFGMVLPPAGSAFVISVTIKSDDGSVATDTYADKAISEQEASWEEFMCKMLKERLKPIPWWEWEPDEIRTILPDYNHRQLVIVEQGLERLLANVKKMISR
jgi:hypothetical protein